MYLKKSLSFERKRNFAKKRRRRNANLLVLPIEEISLRPELSCPPRFRFQRGSPERDTGGGGGVVVLGWYLPFLI